MADKTERIIFTADINDLTRKMDRANIKIQEERDKIKELTKAIKELGKESGARKDLIIDKAKAEANIKKLKTEIKEYDKAVGKANKNTKASFGEVALKVAIAGAAIKKMVGVVGSLIIASNKEEDSQRKVNFMFEEQGKNVIALAANLQKLTGVDNQVIQDMAVMAKTMGASNSNMEKLLQGSIGFEKALMGVSAKAAMTGLTRAIEQQDFEMIDRWIPAVKNAQTENEKMAILNERIATTYEMATDRMNTNAGAFETLANTYKDESEKIGDQINKSLGMGQDSALNKAMKGISTFFQWMIQGLRGLGVNIGIFVDNNIVLVMALGEGMLAVFTGVAKTSVGIFKGIGKDLESLMSLDFKNIGKGAASGLVEGLSNIKTEIKEIIDNTVITKFKMDVFELKSGINEVSTSLKDSAEAIEDETVAVKALNEVLEENVEIKVSEEYKARKKAQDDFIKNTKITYDKLKALKDEENPFPFVMTPEEEEIAKQKYIDMAEWTIQQAQQMGAILSQLTQKEIQEIDQTKNKKIAALDEQAMSQEEYAKAVLKIEKASEKEKTAILKRQQKIDIAMATAATAMAVLKAFTATDNIVTWQMWTQAALAGAMGMAQIRTIAAQEFEDGGIPNEILSNKSTESIVLRDRNTGRAVGTMDPNEAIIPASTTRNPASQALINSALMNDGRAPMFSGVGSAGIASQQSPAPINISSEIRIDNDELVNLISVKQGDQMRAGEDIWQ